MTIKQILLTGLIILLAAVGGCAIFAPKAPVSQSSLQLLLDAQWNLSEWGDVTHSESLLDGSRITLDFESSYAEALKGRIAGHGGCNSYFGDYEINGDTLSIRSIGSTKIYCNDPEGLMEQEERFFTRLLKVRKFEVLNGSLEISNATGEHMIFVGAIP